MAKVIQNTERAYGYNYTSLASLAQAGVEIPKMRTSTADGKEYVEYLDDAGVWQRGAQIVVPEMKGMNAAQAYGSALTYARRYTVMMAMSVACTDDQLLEASEPKPSKPTAAKEPVKAKGEGNYTTREEKAETPPKNAEKNTVDMTTCSDCGKPITKVGKYDIMTIAQRTLAGHGRVLCWDCASKASMARKETNNA